MDTKDWGTVESQLSNVRERGRALEVLADVERNLANVKRWLAGA